MSPDTIFSRTRKGGVAMALQSMPMELPSDIAQLAHVSYRDTVDAGALIDAITADMSRSINPAANAATEKKLARTCIATDDATQAKLLTLLVKLAGGEPELVASREVMDVALPQIFSRSAGK